MEVNGEPQQSFRKDTRPIGERIERSIPVEPIRCRRGQRPFDDCRPNNFQLKRNVFPVKMTSIDSLWRLMVAWRAFIANSLLNRQRQTELDVAFSPRSINQINNDYAKTLYLVLGDNRTLLFPSLLVNDAAAKKAVSKDFDGRPMKVYRDCAES